MRVVARRNICRENVSRFFKALPQSSVNALFPVKQYREGKLLINYSIVAKRQETNQIGIAVASKFFVCGVLVPYITQDAVVAS